MKRRRRKANSILEGIPAKANRVLNLVLIGFALITLRVWQLSVIQHEKKLEESRKPQKRVVIDPAKRGTIRDRFNTPLAINKIKYQAAIMYSQIRQIPSIKWENEEGKKVKRLKRKEYIEKLSRLLGFELHMDPERIEDLIHSKAALYNNLPYVIKEDVTEQQYYRLKALEKDWLGIHMQCVPARYYPLKKVGADLIGYTGAISKGEYEGVIQEIKSLEAFLLIRATEEDALLPDGIESVEQAEKRLQELVEHAYSANDHVGKIGIEGKFEERLRGFYGKKSYYSDARGNFLRELPDSKPPASGERILLTISAELQQFAEELLIQNDKIRVPRVTGVKNADAKSLANKHPWIKGGAIVAMEPKSGDILALATYPRFDPNDFISSGNPEISQIKNSNIRKWFENEKYLAEIWDQKRSLEREVYDPLERKVQEERVWLTWEKYLEFILPDENVVKESLDKINTVQEAVFIQRQASRLISLSEDGALYSFFNLIYKSPFDKPYGSRLPAVQQEALEEALLKNPDIVFDVKEKLDPYLSGISQNYDKVLFIDLLRVLVNADQFPEHLLPSISRMSLSSYRSLNAAWVVLEGVSKNMAKGIFRENDFKKWRQENQKEFLKRKREEEKQDGIKYAKPYLDLLDKKEEELFELFWEKNRWGLLQTFLTGKNSCVKPELESYSSYFITWEKELSQGAHIAAEWRKAYTTLKKSVQLLSEEEAFAFMKTLRGFNDLTRPLLGKYRYLRKQFGVQYEKHLAAAFYPLYGYGFGRSHAYRQAATQGSIFKIITSYEVLCQKYSQVKKEIKDFSLLNPFVMEDNTHKRGKTVFVGYNNDGKPIPQLYKGGRIPRSHRSGMGKVDLLKAFEISSNPYFSILAVDFLHHPNDLTRAAEQFGYGSLTGVDLSGEIAGRVPHDLDCNRNGLYAMAIGQHSLVVTPLQTASMLATIANKGETVKPKIVSMAIGSRGIQAFPTEIKRQVFLPKEVRGVLLEGMRRVSKRAEQSAWGSLATLYEDYPEAISDLLEMKGQLVGKSSTSESVENIDLDVEFGTNIYNHTWFGGIVFESQGEKGEKRFLFHDSEGNPELVVVVYLRFGAWGKDSVPPAAQIARKWREIKEKHHLNFL